MRGPQPPGRRVDGGQGHERGPRSGVRAALAGLGLWRRLVAAERLPVLGMIATVLIAAVLLAGGARLLHQVSAQDLRHATAQGEAEQRTITIETDERIGAAAGDEPFRQIDRRGQDYQDDVIPAAVGELLGERQFVMTTPRFRVSSFPDQDDGPFTLRFNFRYQQGIEEQMTLVEGELPGAAESIELLLGADCGDDPLAVEGFEFDFDVECRAVFVPVHQVVVTAQTAQDLMLETGQLAILRPDIQDRHWAFTFGPALQQRIVLEISGIVELSDQDDPYWYDEPSVHRPRITETADFRIVDAIGVIDPGEYRRLVRDVQDVHFDFEWRYPIDSERIDPAQVPELLGELERLTAPDAEVVTRFPAVLRGHLAQRALAVALLSTAFAGVVVVAASAVWVLMALAVARQMHTWRLVLERGVRRNRVVAVGAVHGVAVALPAVAVALVATVVAVPDAPLRNAVPAVCALAVAVIVASVGSTAVAVRRHSGGGDIVVADHDQQGVLSAQGARRARVLVRDGSLVGLAIGAVFLVRRRSDGSGLDAAGSLDALLTIAPPLIGAGIVVVVLRLAGPAFAAMARVGARLRGAVGFVGLRRLAAGDRAARSTLAVVVLALGLAGFASSVQASVRAGQQAQSWQIVGADAEIRRFGPPGLALDEDLVGHLRESGRVVAVGAEFPNTLLFDQSTGEPGSTSVDVLAVESAELGRVLQNAPGAAATDEILATLGNDQVNGEATLPALAIGPWVGGRPSIGQRFRTLLDGSAVEFVVVDHADRFPGMAPGRPSMVVDFDRLRIDRPVAATVVRLGGPVVPNALRQVAADLDPAAEVRSRSEVVAAVTGDPFTTWVGRGLNALRWFAVGLACAAALTGLGLSGPARRRDLGLLAVLGARRRQVAGVTFLEQMVLLAVSLAGGVCLAVVLVEVLGSTLGVDAFVAGFGTVGSRRAVVPVDVDLHVPSMAVSAGGLVAMMTIGCGSIVGGHRRAHVGRLEHVESEEVR